MSADLFRKLSALKLSNDQIAGVMEIMEAEAEVRKAKGRERVQKWRERKAGNVTKHHVTSENISERLTRADDAPDLENKQTNKQERKQDSAPMARVGLKEFADELSAVLNTERIDALIAVRRKKGAVFSAHAGRLLVKALLACPDPRAAADEMVLRNWTGIKPDWLESRSRQNGHGPPAGKRMNAVEAYLSLEAERQNEQSSRTIDNGDDERLSPDKPGLPRPASDFGQTFAWPVRQRDH